MGNAVPGHHPLSAVRDLYFVIRFAFKIHPSCCPPPYTHFLLLQEAEPKKRKICPADENDSGIEVYYREEEDDDQEEEAAKKSQVRSLKENLSLNDFPVLLRCISSGLGDSKYHYCR